jgi:hypothetical protein
MANNDRTSTGSFRVGNPKYQPGTNSFCDRLQEPVLNPHSTNISLQTPRTRLETPKYINHGLRDTEVSITDLETPKYQSRTQAHDSSSSLRHTVLDLHLLEVSIHIPTNTSRKRETRSWNFPTASHPKDKTHYPTLEMIDNTYTLATHTHEIYINQHTLSVFCWRFLLAVELDRCSDDRRVPPNLETMIKAHLDVALVERHR